MDDFLKNTTTTQWWLSVVVVGVLVNLASNYVQRGVDVTKSWFPAWLRTQSEKARTLHDERVQAVSSSIEMRLIVMGMEARCRMKALHANGACIVCAGLAITGKLLYGPLPTYRPSAFGDIATLLSIAILLLWAVISLLAARAYEREALLWERALKASGLKAP